MRWLKDSSPEGKERKIDNSYLNNIRVSNSTYELIKALKEKDGFKKNQWDDWFKLKFVEQKKSKQEKFENIVSEFFYKNDYEQWIKNFALNLDGIWNEKSAKNLVPQENDTVSDSAIVIGRGPSLKKHKHLEILAKSDFQGSIVCTDGALNTALEAGVTPDKFPKFYVVTIDAYEGVHEFYDQKLVDMYGEKIKGIFSVLTHNKVVNRARKAGIDMYWVHALFDYNEGKKSFNNISATMIKAKDNHKGLPGIQTGGNVGTSSWFLSWQILKCRNICLIGINHGWEETDSIETIISHGGNINPPKIEPESHAFKKLFPKVYNPEFKTNCILDPTFQFYSEALKEFISRSPSNLTTINATEGGSIFGKNIICMKFEEFLDKFKK